MVLKYDFNLLRQRRTRKRKYFILRLVIKQSLLEPVDDCGPSQSLENLNVHVLFEKLHAWCKSAFFNFLEDYFIYFKKEFGSKLITVLSNHCHLLLPRV